MRTGLIVLLMLLLRASPATAGVSIGINLNVYPDLVAVPGYPVYYAPQMNSNYFFYDGSYWVYSDDNWYESSWYNGPWELTDPYFVPVFVLRIPVRYYRRPPLPIYQQKYSGDRYPEVEQQKALQSRNYHYQPRDTVPRQNQGAPQNKKQDQGH